MIKVEKGNLMIEGELGEIRADLAYLVYKLHHDILAPHIGEDESKETILDTVTRGFKSREQIVEEAKEAKKEFVLVDKGELGDLVSSIFEHIMEKKGGAKDDL